MRGRLIIRTEPWRERWMPNAPPVLTTFAYLKIPIDGDPRVASLLPELRMAHVKTMFDDAFVVLGLERTSHELGKGWTTRRHGGAGWPIALRPAISATG